MPVAHDQSDKNYQKRGRLKIQLYTGHQVTNKRWSTSVSTNNTWTTTKSTY